MDSLEKKTQSPGFSDLLGGKLLLNASIENYYDLILLSRAGITKASADSVISFTGMSKNSFVEEILNMSIKTLDRKQGDDKLDKRTSSLVIEVSRVLEHTYRIFDDKEKVQRWLSKMTKEPTSYIHQKIHHWLFWKALFIWMPKRHQKTYISSKLMFIMKI